MSIPVEVPGWPFNNTADNSSLIVNTSVPVPASDIAYGGTPDNPIYFFARGLGTEAGRATGPRGGAAVPSRSASPTLRATRSAASGTAPRTRSTGASAPRPSAGARSRSSRAAGPSPTTSHTWRSTLRANSGNGLWGAAPRTHRAARPITASSGTTRRYAASRFRAGRPSSQRCRVRTSGRLSTAF